MIDTDGTTRRVEELSIGDAVLDPLAQKYIKIAHIVPWVAGQSPDTAPVFIPKHSLNATQPNTDFIAPQTLELLIARKSKGQALPSATRVLARDLVGDGIAHMAEQLSGMQCFLLGLEAPAMILGNGVLCTCKTLSAVRTA